MQQNDPPVIPPNLQGKRIVVIPRFLLYLYLLVLILPIMVLALWTFRWLKEAIVIDVHSYTGPFYLTVLEMHSEPNHFMERVRVKYEKDMTASLWVADLKEAGIFETHSPGGQVYYRDGNPDITRDSIDAQAHGGFSTCDISFEITTTSTNTIWKSSMTDASGGRMSGSRALPAPLAVSGVQTNWPDPYERYSEIPLANLGNYKIFVSVK